MQYCQLYLSTYTTTSAITKMDWWTQEIQPDMWDESLLFFLDANEGMVFAGLTTYDDRSYKFKFRYHCSTTTTRLRLIKNGIRDMCLHFTPNDEYTQLHLDSWNDVPMKNPNFFDAEGIISAVINIVSI